MPTPFGSRSVWIPLRWDHVQRDHVQRDPGRWDPDRWDPCPMLAYWRLDPCRFATRSVLFAAYACLVHPPVSPPPSHPRAQTRSQSVAPEYAAVTGRAAPRGPVEVDSTKAKRAVQPTAAAAPPPPPERGDRMRAMDGTVGRVRLGHKTGWFRLELADHR
jgi:hypothetical protein